MRRFDTTARPLRADAPIAIPIQPRPLSTWVGRLRQYPDLPACIVRRWRPGDPPNCRLCPRCSAWDHEDGQGPACTVNAPFDLPDDAAPLYRIGDGRRAPDRSHQATWVVGGVRRIVLHAWTDDQWLRLPEAERPPDAQRLGTLGWCYLRAEGGDE